MKKFKISFLTFISTFLLSVMFGWVASSIIVFFVIFIIKMISGQEKRRVKENFIYYLGQFSSIALGCLANVLEVYLIGILGI